MILISSFKDRLREAMDGRSVTDFAAELGISKQSVSAYINGTRKPKRLTISAMAQILSVNPAWLMGYDVDKYIDPPANDTLKTGGDLAEEFDNIFKIEKKRYPLLGDIACGEPIYADEDHESYVLAGGKVDADFCLRAKGDSMTGARIYDGDIVFIKQMPVVNNGDIAAVIIGDEATLKRVYYYPDKKKLVLYAENQKYEPFMFVGKELDQIRILGKAVAFQSLVR